MRSDRYARTMEDAQLAFSDVTVYAGDGTTLIGTISQAALLARKPDRPAHISPEVIRPRRDPMPSVAPIRTMVRRLKREPA